MYDFAWKIFHVAFILNCSKRYQTTKLFIFDELLVSGLGFLSYNKKIWCQCKHFFHKEIKCEHFKRSKKIIKSKRLVLCKSSARESGWRFNARSKSMIFAEKNYCAVEVLRWSQRLIDVIFYEDSDSLGRFYSVLLNFRCHREYLREKMTKNNQFWKKK